MCGLVRLRNDQVNGTLNILVVPTYSDWNGSERSTLAGGSGGLERKALLAISLLIMCCNFSIVIVISFGVPLKVSFGQLCWLKYDEVSSVLVGSLKLKSNSVCSSLPTILVR